ncbi:hypothetical protein LUZ60_017691 [Juncus effusus]|nr:hypothetical protein LUZ60_017691 [Juncus effusus]
MWIAEGLIPFNYKCSQEESVRKYLTELAHRSVIQVVEMSKTHGWIKSIQMHDILREFCIEKSAKTGFLKSCNNHRDLEAFTSNGMKTYRAAFNKYFRDEVVEYMPDLRTLSFNLTQPSLCWLNYLRVLELTRISNIKKLPDEFGRMIFLRYIGLRDCDEVTVPSSIKYLINLQTFDARETLINSLSGSIWKIPTLRHVYMCFSDGKIRFPKHGELQNIQTLHIEFSCGTKASKRGEFLKMLKERSEIFSFYLEWQLLPLEPLDVLSSHSNLMELGLSGNYLENKSLPDNTLFPPNLRKLRLARIYLLEDPMRILELLPSLVVLELGVDTYNGERMSCSAVGFPRLQHMSITELKILVEWKIEAGSLPKLSKLSLARCNNLKIQAEELVHLPSLEELQLIRMPKLPKKTRTKLEKMRCNVIIKEGSVNCSS